MYLRQGHEEFLAAVKSAFPNNVAATTTPAHEVQAMSCVEFARVESVTYIVGPPAVCCVQLLLRDKSELGPVTMYFCDIGIFLIQSYCYKVTSDCRKCVGLHHPSIHIRGGDGGPLEGRQGNIYLRIFNTSNALTGMPFQMRIDGNELHTGVIKDVHAFNSLEPDSPWRTCVVSWSTGWRNQLASSSAYILQIR